LRRAIAALGAAAALVAALAVLADPAASGRPSDPQPVHFKFHRAGQSAAVESNGRYVFVIGKTAKVGTLLDNQTGRKITMPAYKQCHGFGYFGGPYLAGPGCGSHGKLTVPLFSLATHRTRTVTIHIKGCKARPRCSVVDAGSDWLDIYFSSGRSSRELYQNLHTGAVKPSPKLRRSQKIDLNSPTLTGSNACRHGEFLVVGAYLERCGSKLHKLILPTMSYLVINSQAAIMWVTRRGQLDGIELPGLRGFAVKTPFAPDNNNYTLTSTTLYVRTGRSGFELWSAPWPFRAGLNK
jgi:hypothetical protein